jgi:hypothetical protein
MSLFLSVRGRGPGTDQERSNPRLEPTLPTFTPTPRKRVMAKKKSGKKKKTKSQ